MAMLKQEILLRQALSELGLRSKRKEFSSKHLVGTTSFRDEEFPLIFPRNQYWNRVPKPYSSRLISFSFEGKIDDEGGRLAALAPFRSHPQSLIRDSAWGRLPLLKRFPSPGYLRRMGDSKFVLCPNHTSWPGPPEHSWTYRFAEAVLTGTIPVVFHNMPLGEKFTRGFKFVFEDEVHELIEGISDEEYLTTVQHNLAQGNRFFLGNEEGFHFSPLVENGKP